MLTLKKIKDNNDFKHMIENAHDYLTERGYTEHGFRHVNYVSDLTGYILQQLNYNKKTIELGKIAGYLHDIGNMFNRKHHGLSGANIVYTELRRMGIPLEDICQVTTAIANHEAEIGHAVSPITAALILADKSDAHRTRVHKKNADEIHDRVNYAIKDSQVKIKPKQMDISLLIDFDTSICQVMDFFEIYLHRMEMCKEASTHLNCRFHLIINNLEILGRLDLSDN